MTYTPWGPSDSATTLARGIVDYTTPSHGGIHLSDARRVELTRMFPKRIGVPPFGAWYEEDCDWAIPYAFLLGPSAEHYEDAKRTLLNWHPGAYLLLVGGSIAVAQSCILRGDYEGGPNLRHYDTCEYCRNCPRPELFVTPLVTFA